MATFEEHLTQLETVIERLERGELPLDESVRLFEEGMRLSNVCKAELDRAEGRIQVLVDPARSAAAADLVLEEDAGEDDEVGMDGDDEEE